MALAEGDLRAAQNYFEQALEINREISDRRAEADNLTNMGRVALADGNMEAARKHLEESLAIVSRSEALQDTAYTVEELAALAQALGDPLRSARLAGAAQTVREATSHALPPDQKETHERTLAAARAALSEEAFIAAWNAGRAMTLEQAVEYALEADDTTHQAQLPA